MCERVFVFVKKTIRANFWRLQVSKLKKALMSAHVDVFPLPHIPYRLRQSLFSCLRLPVLDHGFLRPGESGERRGRDRLLPFVGGMPGRTLRGIRNCLRLVLAVRTLNTN